jgi:hypothetical protein
MMKQALEAVVLDVPAEVRCFPDFLGKEGEIGRHDPAILALAFLTLGVVLQQMNDLDGIASELSTGFFYPPRKETHIIGPVFLLERDDQILFVLKDELCIHKNFPK